MAANIYSPSDGEIVGIVVLGLLVICIILFVLYHLEKCREKSSSELLPQLQLNERREEEPASKSTIRYSEPLSTDHAARQVAAMRLNPFSRRGARHLGDHSESVVVKFYFALDWEEEGKRRDRADGRARAEAEEEEKAEGEGEGEGEEEEDDMMAEVTEPPAPRTLPPVLRKIPYLPPILETCVVDDCSTHRSADTTIDTDRQAPPPIPIGDIEEGILRAVEARQQQQEHSRSVSADRPLPAPCLDLESREWGGVGVGVGVRAGQRGAGGVGRGGSDGDSDEGMEEDDEEFREIELPDHHAMSLVLDTGSSDEEGGRERQGSIKLPAARHPEA